MTWLKQARVLASAEKQKEIDVKMQEVQKQASEGSLFGMAEEPVPVMSQPQVGMNGRSQPVMQQPEMFPEQHVHVTNPEPVMQTVHQQIPHETHQTAFVENGTYVQPAPNRPAMQGTGMPQGVAMQPYPQDFHQPKLSLILHDRHSNRQTDIFRTERCKCRTEMGVNTRAYRPRMKHSVSIRKTRMTGNS